MSSGIKRSEVQPAGGLLGAGTFGQVSRVIYREKTCAQKVVNLSDSKRFPTSDDVDNEINRQIDIWVQLEHENLVQYFGHYKDGPKLFVVMEFVDGGDLRKLMSKIKRPQNALLLRWLTELAGVISYLHGKDPVIIHRDIKLSNLLISISSTRKKYIIKLCDFGFIRYRTAPNVNAMSRCGTATYWGPEMFSSSNTGTSSPPAESRNVDILSQNQQCVDIYAMAVVGNALFAWEVPYGEACKSMGKKEFEVFLCEHVVQNRGRPTIADECPSEIMDVIKESWAQNAEHRPTADAVFKRLICVEMSDEPESDNPFEARHGEFVPSVVDMASAASSEPSNTSETPFFRN